MLSRARAAVVPAALLSFWNLAGLGVLIGAITLMFLHKKESSHG